MKHLVICLFLSAASIAQAGNVNYENCLSNMNSEDRRGVDKSKPMPDDAPPFVINPEGQIDVVDAGRVVSRSKSGDTETITYKVIHKVWDPKTKTTQAVPGRQSYEIKRANGLILSINRISDLNRQIEDQKQDPSLSLYRGEKTLYRYDGGDCQWLQDTFYYSRTKDSPAVGLVNHDRALCEALTPAIKVVGTQKIDACMGAFHFAEDVFKKRNVELKKEGKQMGALLRSPTAQLEDSKPDQFDFMYAMSRCVGLYYEMYQKEEAKDGRTSDSNKSDKSSAVR